MTAKEYLQQARIIDSRIKLMREKLMAMRSAVYGSSPALSNSINREHSENGTEKAVQRVIEYEEYINAEIKKLVEKRLEIERVINAVPDEVQREVLVRRYLLYEDLETIADKIGYSYRHITRIHGWALKSVKDVLECPILPMI